MENKIAKEFNEFAKEFGLISTPTSYHKYTIDINSDKFIQFLISEYREKYIQFVKSQYNNYIENDCEKIIVEK